MQVYIVIEYHPGYETEIVAVWATKVQAEEDCERRGMEDHGVEAHTVQGL